MSKHLEGTIILTRCWCVKWRTWYLHFQLHLTDLSELWSELWSEYVFTRKYSIWCFQTLNILVKGSCGFSFRVRYKMAFSSDWKTLIQAGNNLDRKSSLTSCWKQFKKRRINSNTQNLRNFLQTSTLERFQATTWYIFCWVKKSTTC